MIPDLPATAASEGGRGIAELLADPELSPGPWYWEPRSRLLPTRIGVEGHRRGVGDYMVAAFIDDSQRPEPGNANADARFIAASRNEVPALLAALDAIRAIHVRTFEGGDRMPDYCSNCVMHWPCPTIAALTVATTPDQEAVS